MITEAQLDALQAKLTADGLTPALAQDLKAAWPEMHFTVCPDDDVCGPKPVRECGGFNLYLVDNSNHCITFTSQLEAATGVVVAEVEDEEF